MTTQRLNNNCLAFMALCNEYCSAMESARESGRTPFVDTMLRLLPRIYISATDLIPPAPLLDEAYLDSYLEEDYYDAVRRNVETLLGPDDTYLEVFEEDMKYSDTPIAASVAEGLADIFQVLYNFLHTVADATDEVTDMAFAAVKSDFGDYWSRPLCNVMRALNHIRYSGEADE